MMRALSMVDGQGTPFWVFLIQFFFILLVGGLAATLVFLGAIHLLRWLDP